MPQGSQTRAAEARTVLNWSWHGTFLSLAFELWFPLVGPSVVMASREGGCVFSDSWGLRLFPLTELDPYLIVLSFS